jgi:ABC-2 type transport system ATP-binding protein
VAADAGPGDMLTVRGASAAAVGDLAARQGVALHELVGRQASLEEAFMELTHDATDYRPRLPGPGEATRA